MQTATPEPTRSFPRPWDRRANGARHLGATEATLIGAGNPTIFIDARSFAWRAQSSGRTLTAVRACAHKMPWLWAAPHVGWWEAGSGPGPGGLTVSRDAGGGSAVASGPAGR